MMAASAIGALLIASPATIVLMAIFPWTTPLTIATPATVFKSPAAAVTIGSCFATRFSTG
jgi:hypothetical protein